MYKAKFFGAMLERQPIYGKALISESNFGRKNESGFAQTGK
jgi:hypothetical protein